MSEGLVDMERFIPLGRAPLAAHISALRVAAYRADRDHEFKEGRVEVMSHSSGWGLCYRLKAKSKEGRGI